MKAAVVLFALLLMPLTGRGQTIESAVGGSQILGTMGIQSTYRDQSRYGWTGMGYQGGFRFGAYLNTPVNMFSLTPDKHFDDKYRLGIGDQYLDSTLTVDEYSHAFTARGVSILYHTKRTDIQAFSGVFSQEEAQSYLHSVQQFDLSPVGAVVGRFRISKTFELRSLNVAGTGLTSIQSLGWTPIKSWHLSSSAGVGNNHGYFANEADYQRDRLHVRTSYTTASHSVHRQDGYNFDIEPLGLNFKVDTPLGLNTLIRYNHMHSLMVVPKYLYARNSSIGTEDEADFTTSFFGFRAGAVVSVNSSDSYVGKQYTGVASLYRRVLPRWSTSFAYVRNASSFQNGDAYQSHNEFRVSNHLAVSQNFSRLNTVDGNTFGGQWSSNRLSFTVDNQIYTSQAAAQFGQKSIFQAWTFSIRLRTVHGTTTNMSTTIDPFGKMQWGGYLSGMQYHGIQGSDDGTNVTFSKYVIKGTVVDENGVGVWGIAVSIGSNTVISNSNGSFFTHVKNAKPMPFAVAVNASLQDQRWTLASAPTVAQGTREESPVSIRVVVQMGSHDREIAQADIN